MRYNIVNMISLRPLWTLMTDGNETIKMKHIVGLASFVKHLDEKMDDMSQRLWVGDIKSAHAIIDDKIKPLVEKVNGITEEHENIHSIRRSMVAEVHTKVNADVDEMLERHIANKVNEAMHNYVNSQNHIINQGLAEMRAAIQRIDAKINSTSISDTQLADMRASIQRIDMRLNSVNIPDVVAPPNNNIKHRFRPASGTW